MRTVAVTIGALAALAIGSRSASAQAQIPDGAALYKQNCAACHGATGVPAEAMAKMFKQLPSFADAAFFAGRTQDSIVAVMQHGAGTAMKSFKDKLNKDQMVAVATYIRTLAKKP